MANDKIKIQFCSDLHLEFSDNKYFMEDNPLILKSEILLLAGDIFPFVYLDKPCDFIDWASDNFEKVYWIPGNHEYYRFDIAKHNFVLNEKIRSNVFLVNNLQVAYKDVEIIFSTLWSKISAANEQKIQKSINDFSLVKINGNPFTPFDFSNLHKECFSFVESAIKNNDKGKTVVVTHHVPTLMNYPPQYKTDPINEAFAVELYNFIEASNADYWVYGHHHTNTDEFIIGKTKMLTNQLGYVGYNEHLKFRRDAVIEI